MLIQNEDMQEFIQDHSREDGGKKKIADATKQGYVMFRSRKKKEKREREGKRKETITTWLSLSLAQVPRKAECGPGLEEEILCSQRGKLLGSIFGTL